MPALSRIVQRFRQKMGLVRIGFYPPDVWLYLPFDLVLRPLFKTSWKDISRLRRARARFKRPDGGFDVNGVRLPALSPEDERFFLTVVLYETFAPYLFLGDRYDPRLLRDMDIESYGYQDGAGFDVAVKPGDVVVDAGSWIGDFAAYAARKGARVYAFEPTPETFGVLRKTAELNPGIIPVDKGLGDEPKRLPLFASASMRNTAGNHFQECGNAETTGEGAEIVTLDSFVRDNGLERVDFIKADIEGYERHMLAGARETLRRFAPRLAICTYHLPDDPEVLERLIREANPDYRIVQGKALLFASV